MGLWRIVASGGRRLTLLCRRAARVPDAVRHKAQQDFGLHGIQPKALFHGGDPLGVNDVVRGVGMAVVLAWCMTRMHRHFAGHLYANIGQTTLMVQ